MGFFVVINGGLLVAYSNQDLGFLEKELILLAGYITTLLSHCLSCCYCRCIAKLSELINEFPKQSDVKYFPPLEYAKKSTTRIVSLFTFILTYPWGILFVSNIGKHVEIPLLCGKLSNDLQTIIFITISNILLHCLLVKILLLGNIAKLVKLESKKCKVLQNFKDR
ncbi:MAG: hypothetical protein LBH43_12655 [Treponema sp.]|jgi:hypothetical protein|nr:hypothetical protein [Treponema sp.]